MLIRCTYWICVSCMLGCVRLVTVNFFGVIWINSDDPKSLVWSCVKEVDESLCIVDSMVALMHNGPSYPTLYFINPDLNHPHYKTIIFVFFIGVIKLWHDFLCLNLMNYYWVYNFSSKHVLVNVHVCEDKYM